MCRKSLSVFRSHLRKTLNWHMKMFCFTVYSTTQKPSSHHNYAPCKMESMAARCWHSSTSDTVIHPSPQILLYSGALSLHTQHCVHYSDQLCNERQPEDLTGPLTAVWAWGTKYNKTRPNLADVNQRLPVLQKKKKKAELWFSSGVYWPPSFFLAICVSLTQ